MYPGESAIQLYARLILDLDLDLSLLKLRNTAQADTHSRIPIGTLLARVSVSRAGRAEPGTSGAARLARGCGGGSAG